MPFASPVTSAVLMATALFLPAVVADQPPDCSTFEGFERMMGEALAVVKASPVDTLQPVTFCGGTMSQFSVSSVVKGHNNVTSGQTISVYGTGDTPGMSSVRTDQGSVLLMMYPPNDFHKTDQECEDSFPALTFALADCGGPKPINGLTTSELRVVGEQVCGVKGDDSCVDDDAYEQCRSLVDGNCGNIARNEETCPAEFSCMDTCCMTQPQCPNGTTSSRTPCGDEEGQCEVVSMCCQAVYCRPLAVDNAAITGTPYTVGLMMAMMAIW